MVPLALLLLISGELAIYAAAAHYFLDLSGVDAAICALAILLGLRAGIVAVTWAFALTYRSPAPDLSLGAALRMLVGEYLAFLLTFVCILPFERLWMGPDRLRRSARPLLLVHGYGCSRGVWWLLRKQLEAAGHTVATLSLTPPYRSIGRLVPQLEQRIDEVCRATGANQVVLIAHSMGGLVCRAYLARNGRTRVERLITISSPHAGSELARIGFGANAREMEPDSLWLQDLAAVEVPVPTIAIRTPHDNCVMPQDNQRLHGALDVELAGLGHLASLYSRRVAGELLATCR